jgi:hypothetical protein
MGIEGEEVQAKGIESILNKIVVVAAHFLNLGKEMVIQLQEAFRASDKTRKKPVYIIL